MKRELSEWKAYPPRGVRLATHEHCLPTGNYRCWIQNTVMLNLLRDVHVRWWHNRERLSCLFLHHSANHSPHVEVVTAYQGPLQKMLKKTVGMDAHYVGSICWAENFISVWKGSVVHRRCSWGEPSRGVVLTILTL